MKKTMKSLVLFFALAFTTVVSAQNNDNGLIGKAKGAAHECLTEAHGMEIFSSVETFGICFVSGELKRVTFYAVPKCHQEPCPKYMVRTIATVDFDCEGNIIAVNCGYYQ